MVTTCFSFGSNRKESCRVQIIKNNNVLLTKRTSFYVLLEQAEDEDGEGGEGDVVEGQVDAVV